MMRCIKIKDTSESGGLTVVLSSVLKEIETCIKLPYWSIYDLDAMGNPGKKPYVGNVIQEIRNSDRGLILTWEQLYNLAESFDSIQLFEILLVGCFRMQDIDSFPGYEKLLEKFPIVIDVTDGYLWRISTEDENVIKRLQLKYGDQGEVVTME